MCCCDGAERVLMEKQKKQFEDVGRYGIMGVVVFTVKQPSLLIKICLT